MSKDSWSVFNEIVQNILAMAIVVVYLYMTIKGIEVPIELTGFTAGILIFFGFKYKK